MASDPGLQATLGDFGGLTPGSDGVSLPQLEQDIAAFLLMRGAYAYAGWGVWGSPVGPSTSSASRVTRSQARLERRLIDAEPTPTATRSLASKRRRTSCAGR